MSDKSKAGSFLLIGGGLVTVGAIWYGVRKSSATVEAIQEAVKKGGVFQSRLTGYWPYVEGLTAKERLMEGGKTDRKGQPLHTLEMHLADPVKHPYVSVAGDYEIFPYGQRILIDAWPNAVFRVVDTGGHFHGAGKLIRVLGHEPLDVAVDSSKTVVPKLASVTIVPGDNFEHGAAVATGKFKGQTVTAGLGLGRGPGITVRRIS